jgi:hypothetical protein
MANTIFDKFLNFGTTRRGKMISWGIVIVSSIVFFIGIATTVSAKSEESIDFIRISGPNIEQKSVMTLDGSIGGYHMEMYKQTASFNVYTTPAGTTTGITIESRSPFIAVEQSTVAPNSAVTLRLVKIKDGKPDERGLYGFSEPDTIQDTGIQNDIGHVIVIKCGNLRQYLYVRVILKTGDTDDFEVRAVLQQSVVGQRDVWIPAPFIDMKYFDRTRYFDETDDLSYFNPIDGPSHINYRILLEFWVFKELVFTTEDIPVETCAEYGISAYAHFDYKELVSSLPNIPSSPTPITGPENRLIFLFGDETAANNDRYVALSPNSNILKLEMIMTYQFWCEFLGSKYYTESDLRIRIVYDNNEN